MVSGPVIVNSATGAESADTLCRRVLLSDGAAHAAGVGGGALLAERPRPASRNLVEDRHVAPAMVGRLQAETHTVGVGVRGVHPDLARSIVAAVAAQSR